MNLLAFINADVEAGSVADFTPANCTPTSSTTQAQSGTRSLRMQAIANGDSVVTSVDFAVTPGVIYTPTIYVKTAVTSRQWFVVTTWKTAAGTQISQFNNATGIFDATNRWTPVRASQAAPVNAAKASVVFVCVGNVAGELHYVDDVGFHDYSSRGTYRDFTKTYRDLSGYRGAIQPLPGVDLDRLDYVRVYITDMFGNRLAPLSAATIKKCSWVLNDSGACEIDLTNVDPATRRLLFMQNEIQIVFTNTTPHTVWQGFPVRRQRKPGLQVHSCEGVRSHLKYRIIETASQLYTSVEQFDIAWGLINIAQQGVNYNRNITASYTPSGFIRSRNYARDQHKIVFDCLKEFDADKLMNGFDADIVCDETGLRLWTPYYPCKGTWYQGYLEWGREIIDYDFKDDGLQMRTKIYATGGSSGIAKFEQSYENVAASNQYGALVGTVSDGAEKDLGWLLSKAQQQVAVRSVPISNYQITLGNDPNNPVLGKFGTGDFVWIRIDDESNQVNAPFRINSIEWQQNETVVVQFVTPNLSGFATPGAQPPL